MNLSHSSNSEGEPPEAESAAHDRSVAAAARVLAEQVPSGEVTLLGHIDPDADALGTALALGHALHDVGVSVRVSFAEPDDVPETLRGLDAAGLLVRPDDLPPTDRVLVAVDTPSIARLGWLGARVERTASSGGAVVVIDHHASNMFYGTHNVVDPGAEASAVVALRVLDAMNLPLTEPVARGLYAGLLTDTSSFRRATPQTHRIAARLVAAGADPDEQGRVLLDDRPFAWLPMLSRVLAGARLEAAAARGLGVVHAVVDLDVARDVRVEEVESVIDVLRSTSEAEVAFVLKERRPHAGVRQWSVSLRAKRAVNVAAVARTLGGGGHHLAAGCRLEGEPEQCIETLLAALSDAPLLESR